jgi:hypothetical protein
MKQQNYSNHRQYVPMFHLVLFGLIVLSLGGSVVNLVKSWGGAHAFYSASLLVVVELCLLLLFFFARIFALKAQDRAIRAEENLRHYVLTGKLLDARLTIRQVIGLRFASDQEFVELTKRAADQDLGEEDIKKAIKNWRGDHYRV